MPVEESANMLLMIAAIVQRLNTTDFLRPYCGVRWKLVHNISIVHYQILAINFVPTILYVICL